MAKHHQQQQSDGRDDPILTLAEAARRFSRSPQTIKRWIDDGLLPAQRIPSGIGVRESVVNGFLRISGLNITNTIGQPAAT